MEFSVLGPLRVTTEDGRIVDVGRPKQRALLAMLLTSAHRMVPVERLIDGLWGANPPRQATISLQTYVSNLRRALEPHRLKRGIGQILVTQNPGYLLKAEAEHIDASRFEKLALLGERMLAEGSPDRAGALLDEALGLWRGPAFADLADAPFTLPEAARLNELQLIALEDRLEARLALGEHRRAVALLESLVLEHPLRERMWGLLMLALYRSGRQGDALNAFRTVRQSIVDQLGLEPGPDLRQLEAVILSQADVTPQRLSGAELRITAYHARLAYEASEAHLHRAAELVSRLPQGADRTTQDLELQLRLAKAVSMTRGWAAPGVLETWQRASASSRELSAHDQLLSAVWGYLVLLAVRGEVSAHPAAIEQLLPGEDGVREDAVLELTRVYVAGYGLLHTGRLADAREKLDRATQIALTLDPDRLMAIFCLHPCGLSISASGVAWALCGHPREAKARRDQLLAFELDAGQPFSRTVALASLALIDVILPNPAAVMEVADQILGLARAIGFFHYICYAGVLRGWAKSQLGEPEAGAVEIQDALANLNSSGWLVQSSIFNGMLGEALKTSGRLDDALSALDEGIALANSTGERFWEAELYRLKGEYTLLRWPNRRQEAEDFLVRAVETARSQGACLLEGRGLRSLDHLRSRAG